MNKKQRLLKTINHKKTDRPACSYEATFEITEELIKYFGLDKRKDINTSSSSGSNQPTAGKRKRKFGLEHEIELQKTLGVDQSIVICPVNSKKAIGNWWGLPLLSRKKDGTILGAWNIVFQEWKYPYGTYIEIHSSPLVEASINEILKVEPPSLDLWDFDAYKDVLVKFQDFFVWMNMNGCFDLARFQRGSEQFFMDLVLEPRKAEILLDKVNDFAICFFLEAISKVKGLVDGVYLGDDFGTQNGLVMSPDMWRKYIKPRYKKLVSVIKNYGLKYCHHSCGGIKPIIPDMIEIGVDVLNPIQPLAAGMEPEVLGKEFGKDLTFYGGIDEQRTLPKGTVKEVKKEVIHRIKTLGKYGGYIVAPSHAFQPDTPIKNVLTVYETVMAKSFNS